MPSLLPEGHKTSMAMIVSTAIGANTATRIQLARLRAASARGLGSECSV
ncbi:hypothetical protein [Arthrobacter sp. NA-172]